MGAGSAGPGWGAGRFRPVFAAATVVAVAGLVAVGSVAATPRVAAAQSTLERTPNVGGVWASPPGVVHFHFLHRFRVTPPPARKVLNSPTFLLAAGLPGGFAVGGRYVTSSLLVAGEPNAWELFGRWASAGDVGRFPLDVSAELARNWTAESWDGELLVGREAGPVRLLAGGRAFSSFGGTGDAGWAVVGGARLRLHRYVALAGDVARLVGGAAADAIGGGEPDAAWGAGLQLEIPYTPHSVSLQVSNANTTTLQGATVGAGDRLWGFEFTAPLTLSRWFGGRDAAGGGVVAASGADGAERGGASASSPTAGGGEAETGPAAVVQMDNRLRYLPDTVRIRVGEMVEWRNGSDIIHTVTGDPAAAALAESVRLPPGAEPFGSGDLRPGDTFTLRFTVPGEYRYFCIPHERAGMVGTVVVTEPTGGG